jgi:hypothetical protein
MLNIFKRRKLRKLQDEKEKVCTRIHELHLDILDTKYIVEHAEMNPGIRNEMIKSIGVKEELLKIYQDDYDTLWNEICELY